MFYQELTFKFDNLSNCFTFLTFENYYFSVTLLIIPSIKNCSWLTITNRMAASGATPVCIMLF